MVFICFIWFYLMLIYLLFSVIFFSFFLYSSIIITTSVSSLLRKVCAIKILTPKNDTHSKIGESKKKLILLSYGSITCFLHKKETFF